MSQFEREIRYTVIKHADLNAVSRKELAACLSSYGIPRRECVVVESDWPIYEAVWDMVQRLAEGRPQQVEELKQDAEEWEQLAYRYQAERDALAAHVGHQHEWLARAERKLTAYVGICSGDKELTDTILPMARQTLETSPITSLVRRDARKEEESLDKFVGNNTLTLDQYQYVVSEKKRLHRQAEEAS